MLIRACWHYFFAFAFVFFLCGCTTPTISKNLLVTPYPINQGQTSGIRQAYTIGGRGADWGSSVLCNNDGSGCMVFGYSIKSFGESTDIFAAKLSPSWEPIWGKTYGGTHKDTIISAIQTRDGGYLLLGDTLSMFNTPLRVFATHYPSPRSLLIKTDVSGNVQWARFVCCNSRGIYETTDGSYLVVGWRYNEQNNKTYTEDITLVKLDSAGKIKWSKTYASAYGNSFCSAVKEASDGGIMIGGAFQTPESDYDAFLLKLTDDGSLVWAKKYEYEKNQGLFNILETEDHNWMLMGPHRGGGGQDAVFVAKVSSSGNVVWSNFYNSIGHYDSGTKMIQGYDKSYLIVGRSDTIDTTDRPEETTKGAILLINEKGDIITSAHIAPPTVLMSASRDGKGKYVLVGTYIRPSRGKYSIFATDWFPQMKEKAEAPFKAVPITLNMKSINMMVGVESTEDAFIQNLDVMDLQVKQDQR